MSSEAIQNSPKTREEFLPFELDYIPEDLQQRAKVELSEDEDTRINSLKLLRSVLKDEPNLHFQDEDQFLLAFLRARKFDVKRAHQLMKNFYVVKDKHEEIYGITDFADMKRSLSNNIMGPLPYRDSDGSVIFVVITDRWNPQHDSLGDIIRILTFSVVQAILSPATQIAGFKLIIDNSGLTLKYLSHITPSYMWLLAQGLQNCFPARFRAVHLIDNPFSSFIWTIIKPFLSKKIKERFHFHKKNGKELQKFFSPSILPAEFDGELPPFDNSEWAKMMEKNAEYFIHVVNHGLLKCKAETQSKKEHGKVKS